MRVYVLGAGASAHAGYPLMTQLGHRLADWCANLPAESVHPTAQAARNFLLELRDAALLDNLETLVHHCDSGDLSIEGWDCWGGKRHGLPSLISKYFKATRPKISTVYERFARIVAPGDVIITFNYDISLEIELSRTGKWHLNDGYGFALQGGGPKSLATILKLHGSANWQATFFEGADGAGGFDPDSFTGPGPTFQPADCEELGYAKFRDPRHRDGARAEYLILPVLKKKFFWKTQFGEDARPFWDSLWGQAESAIARCEEMILIGYSLPEADERGRELLLQAPTRHVPLKICCGSDSERIGNDFRQAGWSDLRIIHEPFEKWMLDRRP